MSDFGYSDNSFEDYSWFRNCIDNSGGGGSSSSGSGCGGNDPNSKFNRVGCWIAAIAWLILFAVISLS